MRTEAPSLVPLLRSDMQARLLGHLLLQPERGWTADELTRLLRASRTSVHRELARAVASGVIREDRARRPHAFRAAPDAPIYEPLRRLLELTVGVPARLRDALADVDGILAATIHGSFARGTMRPDSDIDVLVVTSGDRRAALRAARGIGRDVGREVDATVLTTDSLGELVAADNPFLSKILRGPQITVTGDLDELVKAADGSR